MSIGEAGVGLDIERVERNAIAALEGKAEEIDGVGRGVGGRRQALKLGIVTLIFEEALTVDRIFAIGGVKTGLHPIGFGFTLRTVKILFGLAEAKEAAENIRSRSIAADHIEAGLDSGHAQII